MPSELTSTVLPETEAVLTVAFEAPAAPEPVLVVLDAVDFVELPPHAANRSDAAIAGRRIFAEWRMGRSLQSKDDPRGRSWQTCSCYRL